MSTVLTSGGMTLDEAQHAGTATCSVMCSGGMTLDEATMSGLESDQYNIACTGGMTLDEAVIVGFAYCYVREVYLTAEVTADLDMPVNVASAIDVTAEVTADIDLGVIT
jgi:hypothetical protein